MWSRRAPSKAGRMGRPAQRMGVDWFAVALILDTEAIADRNSRLTLMRLTGRAAGGHADGTTISGDL
jgi:hypothetical protein